MTCWSSSPVRLSRTPGAFRYSAIEFEDDQYWRCSVYLQAGDDGVGSGRQHRNQLVLGWLRPRGCCDAFADRDTVRHVFDDCVFADRDLTRPVAKYRFPQEGTLPRDAYQLVADELMLDGNARQNLATFCQTWEEPEALALMALSVNKNMIDRDEYPQTAQIDRRCVHM